MRSFTTLSSVVSLAGLVAAGKRGVSWPYYNENTPLDPGVFNSDQVSYMYNWETWRPSKTGSLNFIGTQALKDSQSSPVGDLQNRAQQQGWTDVFSLNEPDLNNISPQDAADWYKQWINLLQIHKGLPAVTSATNAGLGLDWLQSFLNSCAGECYHDYINLHWYGGSFSEFQTYVQNAHNRFPDEKIVVSEYALTAPANADQQRDFFSSAVTFLDNLSYVVMHFPFTATSAGLMQANDGGAVSNVGTGCTSLNDDGSLNAIGQVIA